MKWAVAFAASAAASADWDAPQMPTHDEMKGVCPQYTVAVPDLETAGVRCLDRSATHELFQAAGVDFDSARIPRSLLEDVDEEGEFNHFKTPPSLMENAQQAKQRQTNELFTSDDSLEKTARLLDADLSGDVKVGTEELSLWTSTIGQLLRGAPIAAANEVAKGASIQKYYATKSRKSTIESFLNQVNAREGLMENAMEVMKELAGKRNELDEAQQGLNEMIATINDLWNSTMQLMYFLDSPVGGCALQTTMMDATLSIGKVNGADEDQYFLMSTPDINPADIEAMMANSTANGSIAGTSPQWAANMQYCGGSLSSCGDVVANAQKCTTTSESGTASVAGASFMQGGDTPSPSSSSDGISDAEIAAMQDYRGIAAREIAFETYVKYQMQTIQMMNLLVDMQNTKDLTEAQNTACINLGCGSTGSTAFKPTKHCQNAGCTQKMSGIGKWWYNNIAPCKNNAKKSSSKSASGSGISQCACTGDYKIALIATSVSDSTGLCTDKTSQCTVPVMQAKSLCCSKTGSADGCDCGNGDQCGYKQAGNTTNSTS